MASLRITAPFPIFNDVDGNPLENGYLYIGEANQNPEAVPVNIFSDAALTVPLAQPIRTLGGYAVLNGAMISIYTATDYSITIRNKNSTLVSTFADSASFSFYTQAEVDALLENYYTQTQTNNLLDLKAQLWQHQATTITPSADADYTLTADENLYGRLVLVDGSWTATHNIIIDTTERTILVDNSAGTYIATVKTLAGTGIAVLSGTKVWLLCDGTNVIDSVDGTTSSVSGVRQTVQSSSVDANGLPNFISAGIGLAVNIAATTVPLKIHSSSLNASDDKLGTVLADASISGLTDTTTNYLYADVAVGGGVTLGSTTLAPNYQFGGTYSIVSGQATFNISEMTMKVGNGASADITRRVFIGEAVTAGGVVTAVVNYALNSYYESDFFAVTASTGYSKNHNVGHTKFVSTYQYKFASANAPFSIGDIVDISINVSTAGNTSVTPRQKTRNAVGFRTSPTTFNFLNDSAATATMTDGSYKITATRGW